MRGLLILLSVIWFGLPVQAEVAGQRDPEFQAAVGDWLAGNEVDALPVLAGLAARENAAARLLLGQIDGFPAFQGDWLAGLARDARIAVLRRPGGLSGQRWTNGLDDPVAQTWAQLWDTSTTAEVINDFATLGEPRAARFAGLTLARRQRQGFAAAADHPGYPASLRAYAMREGWKAPVAPDPADLQWAVLGLAPDPAGFAVWAATAPEADAVVALCETICASEPAEICLSAAVHGLGGYWGVMVLGSPVEALVASAVFNRSPRGVAATLRHMDGPLQSQCLTRALQ